MQCNHCGRELPAEKFYFHSNGKPRKQCKECHALRGKQWVANNREHINKKAREKSPEAKEKALAASRRWRESNKAYDASRSAARRAKTKQATPLWADHEKIRLIYENCPKGMHVDHIVPLNSNIACGLHVEYNLQYLTPEDNWRKGNGRERCSLR